MCLIIGGERNDIRIAKGENRAVINDFNPTKEYTVKVIAVSGKQQSKALQGTYTGMKHGVLFPQSCLANLFAEETFWRRGDGYIRFGVGYGGGIVLSRATVYTARNSLTVLVWGHSSRL